MGAPALAPRTAATALLLALAAGNVGCASAPPPTSARLAQVAPAATSSAKAPGELVLVPGGTFMMGDVERAPPQQQTVASFEIERTEVTTAAYRKCFAAGACSVAKAAGERQPDRPGACDDFKVECNFARSDREDHPINCVTAPQAEAYCRWRGRRLPTEAEWEYAARGQEGRPFPWGDRLWVPERANLCDKSCPSGGSCSFAPESNRLSDGYATTAPVGSFPNGDTPSGIADLMGNVGEWTATFEPGNPRTHMPTGRVVRGSTWGFLADLGFRAPLVDNYSFPDVGFRCAHDVKTTPGHVEHHTERK